MNPSEPERAAEPPRRPHPSPSPPPSDEPGEAASTPSAEGPPTDPGIAAPRQEPEAPAAEAPAPASAWPWFGATDQQPPAGSRADPAPEPERLAGREAVAVPDTDPDDEAAGAQGPLRDPRQAGDGPPTVPWRVLPPGPAAGPPPRHAPDPSANGRPAGGQPPGLGGGAPPSQWGLVVPQRGWQPPPGWATPATRPGRRRGLLLAAAAALLVAVLALVGLVARERGVEAPARRSLAGRSTSSPQVAPEVAANRLLSARARAILARDKAGFLAGIDRRRTSFYASQSRLFDNLATVPFQDFKYRLVDPEDDLATPSLRRRYGTARVYLPETEARYRFQGHDGSPVLSRFFYTFVQTPAGWRIAAQGEAEPAGVDDVEIWDGGPVRTAVTKRTLVVYHPGDRTLANRMLLAAERAYAQIDDSWSGRWEHRVVIVVPHDQGEAQRLVGGTNLSKVAAVASSSIEAGPVERVLGNRVVVNTSNIADYDSLNLQVVITHEMTHVATRTLGSGEPLFLVEGFADYTALRPIAQPLSVTRPALARRVTQGRFDHQLPSDDAFRTSNDAAAAYDEASSFCLWVAATYGNPRLQVLFRAFAGSQKPSFAQQDSHFQEVLGIGLRTAEARWAAWVQRQL